MSLYLSFSPYYEVLKTISGLAVRNCVNPIVGHSLQSQLRASEPTDLLASAAFGGQTPLLRFNPRKRTTMVSMIWSVGSPVSHSCTLQESQPSPSDLLGVNFMPESLKLYRPSKSCTTYPRWTRVLNIRYVVVSGTRRLSDISFVFTGDSHLYRYSRTSRVRITNGTE